MRDGDRAVTGWANSLLRNLQLPGASISGPTDGFRKTRWACPYKFCRFVFALEWTAKTRSGNLTSSPKYDVYGNVRSNGGAASTKHGFVGSLGHLSEAETGLIYVRARYIDPAVGRFVSQDPKCDGANWFVYCGNNPVNAVDPDGGSMRQIGSVVFAILTFLLFAGLSLVEFKKVIIAVNAIIDVAEAVIGEAWEICTVASTLDLVPGYGFELAYGLTCVAVGTAAAATVLAICALDAIFIWEILSQVDDAYEGPNGSFDY